jgi:hypothetical protein
MSLTLMQSTLRIVSLSSGDSQSDRIPVGKSILRKFGRCLEQAGYPVAQQFLGASDGTPRQGVELIGELSEPADLVMINFGPTVSLAEYRRDVEQLIGIARTLNPEVWIVLWGNPPVQNDEKRNEQLLRYNSELHDIANYEGVSYFPTKPIVESLTAHEAISNQAQLHEKITAGIATGIAHTYLSQLQRTLA